MKRAEMPGFSSMVVLLALGSAPVLTGQGQNANGANLKPPVMLTGQQDHQRLMDLLHIDKPPRPGAGGNNRPAPDAANEDESKANPYPKLPDPLVLKDREKVADGQTRWTKRRPEIVEDFDREIYGRAPEDMPAVTWKVTGTNNNGTTITWTVVGHVDNSTYPLMDVNIEVNLTLPAKAIEH